MPKKVESNELRVVDYSPRVDGYVFKLAGGDPVYATRRLPYVQVLLDLGEYRHLNRDFAAQQLPAGVASERVRIVEDFILSEN